MERAIFIVTETSQGAEEQDTKEQRDEDDAADNESMDGDETADGREKDSGPRQFRLPSTSAAVPIGVAAWNELALGGEAEGGNVLSQLLAIGYYIDEVHTVQSHSFLVPCFARGGVDAPSAALGLDTPVHAAGGCSCGRRVVWYSVVLSPARNLATSII